MRGVQGKVEMEGMQRDVEESGGGDSQLELQEAMEGSEKKGIEDQ